MKHGFESVSSVMSQNFWSTSIPLVAKNSPFPSKIPWNFRVVSGCLIVVSTFTSHRFTSHLSPNSVNPPHPLLLPYSTPNPESLESYGFSGPVTGMWKSGGPRWCLDHHHPIRIPKDMGIVWETYHKGVPLSGVHENTLDLNHLGFWFVHHFGGRRLFT